MSEDLVDIVMNIHQFNQDLTRLNIKYSETIEEQQKEIEILENIIKEVREYAEKMLESYDSKGLLEILDKGEIK